MLTSVILTAIVLFYVMLSTLKRLYSLWSTTGGISPASFLPSYVSQFSSFIVLSSHSAFPVIHPVASSYFQLVKHTLVPLPLCLALLLSLLLSDPLQTCLFGATTHLGPCCRSPAVIEARIRTSTEKCKMCVSVCVLVCMFVCQVMHAERRRKKMSKKRKKLQKRVVTHSNRMCYSLDM